MASQWEDDPLGLDISKDNDVRTTSNQGKTTTPSLTRPVLQLGQE